MRRSLLLRHLMASTLPVVLLIGSASDTAMAQPMIARNLSSYGMPGGIDTPTAEALPDGTIGATISYSDYARRNNLFFQALPRVTAALRYSRIDGIEDHHGQGHIWDRSLDLRLQVLDESGWRPALAIGVQDFMGTGVYSGEYIVATKNLTPTIRASAGLGWGTLAGKPRQIDVEDTGGKPNVDDWFSGGAKPFASVSWDATDRLTLIAEYSHDSYLVDHSDKNYLIQMGKEPASKLNLGLSYRLGENYQIGAYTIGGETFGAQFSLLLNPKQAPFPSGLEGAPAPVRPRPAPAADPMGWSGQWAADPTAQPAIQTALAEALENEGQQLESLRLQPDRAEIRIRNERYLHQAEAVGRTARLMTRALPPSVETLVITSVENGVPVSSVTLRRSDLERLENTSSDKIAAVAAIGEANLSDVGMVATPGLYPQFRWHLGPYLDLGLFDPQEPLRYELGAELRASYELMPGLVLSGSLRQRALGTMDQRGPGIPEEQCDNYDPCGRGHYFDPDEYEANPELETHNGVPRVRSDGRMYRGSGPVIPDLTLAWYARPTDQVYTRVTAGLLERAYGGVSAEALWKPVDSRLAIGAEINRVRKRDFEDVFGFRDYEVTTGHVSAYYEFAQGFTAQLDIGQYLAGDRGATLSVTREFANGWRVGAFATKTDISEEDFGEGSFDKGITLAIPLGWMTGQPSTSVASNKLHSLTRDGGARLNVRGRLYEPVRDSHQGKLYDGWGKFWR